jgi:hypothetical protein
VTDPAGADVSRAFGATNRQRLLDHYFNEVATEPVTAESAWRHTYRLLMWIDRTIALAHCYESDKCQPGRPWYARSLRFHQWLAGELGVSARGLSDEIDWLFQSAARDLARSAQSRAATQLARAAAQRAPYEADDMPMPGEDPELEELIELVLQDALVERHPPELARRLAEHVQTYISSENKRKNLVGEGFEDTVAELLRRNPSIAAAYDVHARPALHELPGFNAPRGKDKTKKVDLALVRRADGRRILISCKWSVRSDREEQFATDFETYANLESAGATFGYVLLTNEFDPARLTAACEMRRLNQEMFSDVVHVNTEGLLSVYQAPTSPKVLRETGGMSRALAHIESGRLCGLADWLVALGAQ